MSSKHDGSEKDRIPSGERRGEKTAKDIRFTRNKDNTILYVTVLDWPGEQLAVASLTSEQFDTTTAQSVRLLGTNHALAWSQDESGLHIHMPVAKAYEDAYPIKIEFTGTIPSLRQINADAGQRKDGSNNAMHSESYKGTLDSLEAYECPQWFRDAKFGIWSHWNGYAVAGVGDWYARNMYREGSGPYNYHVKTYGHPSEFGYKDVIETWKADKFDPEGQMKLFKQAGAKYFVALANHHDNFDLWDSTHQKWNSVNYGPKINIQS